MAIAGPTETEVIGILSQVDMSIESAPIRLVQLFTFQARDRDNGNIVALMRTRKQS